jgi:alpha-glucosidase
MVGADFLVAPVLEPGVTLQSAYLPQGLWMHLWTGAVYGSSSHGVSVTVAAPVGQPAVFHSNSTAARAVVVLLCQQSLLSSSAC